MPQQVDKHGILDHDNSFTNGSNSETWKMTDWTVGDPITEELMDNTETGIAILVTQKNIIEEKLRKLLWEVCGTDSPSNDGDGAKGYSGSNIDKIIQEIWGSTFNSTSSSLGDTSSRIDDLEKEIGGTRSSGNGYNSSRIDDLETTVGHLVNEVGGNVAENSLWYNNSNIDKIIKEIWNTTFDSTSSDLTDKESRLDKFQEEIWGKYSSGNLIETTAVSRIDNLETTVNTHTNQIGILNERVKYKYTESEKQLELFLGPEKT